MLFRSEPSLFKNPCPHAFGQKLYAPPHIFLIFVPLNSTPTPRRTFHYFYAIPTILNLECLVVSAFQIPMSHHRINSLLALFPVFFLVIPTSTKVIYRCLDLVSGRVHVSRHVTFVETSFPFATRAPTTDFVPTDTSPTPCHPTPTPLHIPISSLHPSTPETSSAAPGNTSPPPAASSAAHSW